jgi:WXXGXW repeat (2 copies)
MSLLVSKNSPRSLLLALLLLVLPVISMAQVGVNISVNLAPPELPVYDQPPIPAPGYLWTPGYWAWSDDFQDYYWVPGTWVAVPQPGYLWTPGYWGSEGGVFLWHEGYWGPQVGFYGGVNYGYGYGGRGFEGGYWQGGQLYYNRSVTNVTNVHITNVYNRTVVNNVSVTRVSYNGGSGGVQAQPTPAELAASHDRHIPPVAAQQQQIQAARSNPGLRASTNHGKPPIAATARPGAFSGSGVVAASRGGAVSAAPAAHEVQPAHPAPAPAPHPAPARPPPAVAHPPPAHPVQEEHREQAPPPRAEAPPRPAPAPRPAPRPEEHPQEHAEHDHDRS